MPLQLDYAKPDHTTRALLFWSVFIVGSFGGIVAANFVDFLINKRQGTLSDGGLTAIGIFAVPVSAVIAMILRSAKGWRRRTGIGCAAALGFILPPAAIILYVAVWSV